MMLIINFCSRSHKGYYTYNFAIVIAIDRNIDLIDLSLVPIVFHLKQTCLKMFFIRHDVTNL